MKMQIVPAAVWSIFRGRFEANLDLLGAADGKRVMDKAKQRYPCFFGKSRLTCPVWDDILPVVFKDSRGRKP